MFVYSFKSKDLRWKLALAAAVALVIIALMVFLPGRARQVSVVTDVNISSQTERQVIDFLKKFGYDVEGEASQCVITIPTQWNETYENYNKLQLRQGLDLSYYRGVMVTRMTYAVSNYTDESGEPCDVVANVYIYDSKIIGGDICSVALDGFMKTFDGQDLDGKIG